MILLVEDEPSVAEVVSLYLGRAGYKVTVAGDGAAAVAALARMEPELVVLDLMLPVIDGLEITRRIRAEGDTPIIMLTARGSEADRIAGLELGADDYVVKPFSPQELVSRVRAVLRRTHSSVPAGEDQAPVVFDSLRIDPLTRFVQVSGEERSLTAKEFDLLWTLARHPRQVFKREQLLELVWGFSDNIDPSTVTVHMRRLREKIEEDAAHPRRIVTVWGVGYRFEPS